MSRPLTGRERDRIEAARRRIEALQGDIAAATRERDLAILDAYNHRGKVVEIAQVAGVARQTIHTIVKQFDQEP